MLETVEYFWDEQTSHGHYVVENTYTGELRQHSKYQPFNWPRDLAPDALREKYFSELVTYLQTPEGPV